MPYIQERKRNRLLHFDYSRPGIYFITMCTYRRKGFFGCIENSRMVLSRSGEIAEECWKEIPRHISGVRLDEFAIMPNHIHGIIIIEKKVSNNFFPGEESYDPTKMLIPIIVQQFKSAVTRKIRFTLGDFSFGWQRSFYDHIVRNERAFFNIRKYIAENPVRWELDIQNRAMGK